MCSTLVLSLTLISTCLYSSEQHLQISEPAQTLDGQHHIEHDNFAIFVLPDSNILPLPDGYTPDFLQGVIGPPSLVAALTRNRLLTFIKKDDDAPWSQNKVDTYLEGAKFMLRSTGNIVLHNEHEIKIYDGWSTPPVCTFMESFDASIQRIFPLEHEGIGVRDSDSSYCSIKRSGASWQMKSPDPSVKEQDPGEGESEYKERQAQSDSHEGNGDSWRSKYHDLQAKVNPLFADLFKLQEQVNKTKQLQRQLEAVRTHLDLLKEQAQLQPNLQDEEKSESADSLPDQQRHTLLQELIQKAEAGEVEGVDDIIAQPSFNPNLHDMQTGRTTLEELLWRLGETRLHDIQKASSQFSRVETNLITVIESLINHQKIELLSNAQLTALNGLLEEKCPHKDLQLIPVSLRNKIAIAKTERSV